MIKRKFLLSVLGLVVMQVSHGAITEQRWNYTYTPEGKVETADGPRADVPDVTSYTYNSFSRLATITNPLGHVESVLEYDAAGRVTKVEDANGVQSALAYTDRGWLKSVTVQAASGDQTTQYGYDATGQLTNTTFPDGQALFYEYDSAHRLVAIENSLNERIEYTLDDAGNIIQETVLSSYGGQLIRSVGRQYDELSRLMAVNGNNGQSSTFSYDANGQRIATTDGNFNTTQEAPDSLGRIATITDAIQATVQYEYDAEDRLTSVTDQRGNATTYQYDFAGNLLQLASPDTGISQFGYDEAGNRISKVDARGITANYSYDALNRLTAISYPGDSSENVTFNYDSTADGNKGVGRLTGYSNEAGSSSLQYDDLGRVTQVDDNIGSWSFTTEYAYDVMGRIARITYPSGRVVNYYRGALGRVSSITTKDNASAPEQTIVSGVQYQPFGGITMLDYGNGIQLTNTYDLDGRLETATATGGAGSIRSNNYSYDLANNITGISDLLDITRDRLFAFDSLNRLTQENYVGGDKSYDYDPVGNRTQDMLTAPDQSQTTNSYTHESTSNRLDQKNGQDWVLDAAGNTISTNAGAKQYAYNHAGRLETYTENGTLKGTYIYNALGQRVRTIKNEDSLLHYNLAGQYLGETNLDSSGGALLRRVDYIYLASRPVAQVATTFLVDGSVASRDITYLHSDHLSTPRVGTDANQTIVWRWDSDAFGMAGPDENPDGDQNDTVVNLRFPGQIKGGEAPFYYNYYRDYDPSLGRYIQSDPIGLAGGLNTYGYVYQNPLSRVDPYGLESAVVNPAEALAGLALITAALAGNQEARDLFSDLGDALSNFFSDNALHADQWVDDPRAAEEWSDYKERYREPPPPNLDECELLKWKLRREQRLLSDRMQWDKRWAPGTHDEPIKQSKNAIRNLKKKIKRVCQEDCL